MDCRVKPGNDASAIVLAMQPASEVCGKRHGKDHETSAFGAVAEQNRRWSPAFFVPIFASERKEGSRTPTDA
jgi:hypothetical protein